jgi:hypothetical protein
MFYPGADETSEQSSLPYQPYRGRSDPFLLSQQQEFVSTPPPTVASPVTPARSAPATSTPTRLSKAEALEFVGTCKRWLIAGSIVAFGILSGLVAGHVTGATASQAAPASNPPTTSPSDGGFFQQGGYGFGSGNSWQPPVSSSRTS